MHSDLGLDDFGVDFSSDLSSDDSISLPELTLPDTELSIHRKYEELQKELNVISQKHEKEIKLKQARIKMIQKACADQIADKENLISDLQDMLEDSSQSSEHKVLVKRIEDLQKTKTDLHQEIIKNQIEYEQRIHEEIFSKCKYCTDEVMNSSFESASDFWRSYFNSKLDTKRKEQSEFNGQNGEEKQHKSYLNQNDEAINISHNEKIMEKEKEIVSIQAEVKILTEKSAKEREELINELNNLRDENSNLKSQNNEVVESNRNFKSRLSENSRALNELNLSLKNKSELLMKQAEELQSNKSSSDDLRKKHDSTRAEFENLKKQVAALEASQEELSSEKEKISEELKVVWKAKLSLEEQVALNRRQERDWSEEMERLKREVQEKSEEVRKEIELSRATMEETREESEVSLKALKEKYSILRKSSEENVRSLQVKERENELMIKTHNDRVNELRAKISSSEDELKKIKELMTNADKDIEDKSFEIKNLIQVITNTNDRLKNQRSTISELEENCLNKIEELKSCKESFDHLKKDNENVVKQLNDEKLTSLEKQKSLLSVEESLNSKISEHEKTKELLNQLMDESEKKENSYNQQLQQLHRKLESTESFLKDSEKSLALNIQAKDELGEILKDYKEHTETAKIMLQADFKRKCELLTFVGDKLSSAERQLELSSKRNDCLQLVVDNQCHEIEFLKEALEERNSVIKENLPSLMKRFNKVVEEMKQINTMVGNIPNFVEECSQHFNKKVMQRLHLTDRMYRKVLLRYRVELQTRKRLHNELIELKGNIRVFVRIRPPHLSIEGNPPNSIQTDKDDDCVIHVTNSRHKLQKYEVDRIFDQNATQQDLYKEVSGLVTSCMDGYNVCIFAYGQTGSGKTYTMEGTANNPGINKRALEDLFNTVEQRSCQWSYTVNVSILEVYNETVRDLLNGSSEKLEIRMSLEGSREIPNLITTQVTTMEEVMKIFEEGRRNRAVASTNMNEHSSRSHAVLIINVSGRSKTDARTLHGKLNLIDLAGSERVSKSGASGDRLKEAQKINKSLLALGDVIQALRHKQNHVPFRNSKLTYLLQDSLSKDSKTLMMVQVSPDTSSVSETNCSLSFAQRVRAVQLNSLNKKHH